jgi:hypothetical protein
MEEKETPKFKTSIRYMIENPNNKLNIEGLAMCLEEIIDRLDDISEKQCCEGYKIDGVERHTCKKHKPYTVKPLEGGYRDDYSVIDEILVEDIYCKECNVDHKPGTRCFYNKKEIDERIREILEKLEYETTARFQGPTDRIKWIDAFRKKYL